MVWKAPELASHHVSIITVINLMQVLLQAPWIPEEQGYLHFQSDLRN